MVCLPTFEPPTEFWNVCDTATLLLLAALNRQMLTKVLNPFCNACVKGAFDCSALVFHKSPRAGEGGEAARGVDAQRSVEGERCDEKKNKTVFAFERPAEKNKLNNISGTAGSKQHLVQRNTGNKQTSSTHSNTGSSFPTHRKEFGHYVAMGD